MMRLIRQIIGCSRRGAMADENAEKIKSDWDRGEREIKARRIAIERLVRQLQKDVTAWQ